MQWKYAFTKWVLNQNYEFYFSGCLSLFIGMEYFCTDVYTWMELLLCLSIASFVIDIFKVFFFLGKKLNQISLTKLAILEAAKITKLSEEKKKKRGFVLYWRKSLFWMKLAEMSWINSVFKASRGVTNYYSSLMIGYGLFWGKF